MDDLEAARIGDASPGGSRFPPCTQTPREATPFGLHWPAA